MKIVNTICYEDSINDFLFNGNSDITDATIVDNPEKAVEKAKAVAIASTKEKTSSEENQVVYTLVDENGIIRYVGRTNNYKRRMDEHRRPGGKIYEYGLEEGVLKFENLTKDQARGLEQHLIVLCHTANLLKDPLIEYYNFTNGVGKHNKKKEKYYKEANDYMEKYPSMFENFLEEERNALKEDMGTWW